MCKRYSSLQIRSTPMSPCRGCGLHCIFQHRTAIWMLVLLLYRAEQIRLRKERCSFSACYFPTVDTAYTFIWTDEFVILLPLPPPSCSSFLLSFSGSGMRYSRCTLEESNHPYALYIVHARYYHCWGLRKRGLILISCAEWRHPAAPCCSERSLTVR